MRGGQ